MNLVSIPANPVPEGRSSGMLKTRDGVALRYARWAPPPGRKGTVCLFPGRAEFIEKYFETVRDLRARGFAVATLDWRGQGGSQRALRNPRKGYVRRFSDYEIDLETFMHEVVLPDCPPPVFRAGAFDGRDRADARRLSGASLVRPHGAAGADDRRCRACAVRCRPARWCGPCAISGSARSTCRAAMRR